MEAYIVKILKFLDAQINRIARNKLQIMGPKIMYPILRLYDKYYQENIFIYLLRIDNNRR